MTALPPDGDQERLAALDEYRLLDTDPEDAYDDIVRLAAQICGVPIAAVSLVDAERQWFKSVVGLPITETPRDTAFCAHTILQRGLLVVPDTHIDLRFADNPLVTGDVGIRFYAGAPLVTARGYVLGSLCVLDRVPRNLTTEQEEALAALAHQVVELMEKARLLAIQRRFIAAVENAETVMRLSHRRLENVLESMSDAIIVLDNDWHYTYVNPKAAQTFSRRPEDMIGRHIWTEFPEGIGQPLYYAYYKAVAEQTPLQVEEYYPPYDRWFENRIYPSAEGLSVFFQDVTERKNSERERRRVEEALRASQRFAQATLDALSAEIAILDGAGTILAVNEAWRRFAPEATSVNRDAAGENYLHVCDAATGEEAEEAQRAAAGIRAVIAGRQDVFTLDYPCRLPRGLRWFHLRATPFPGDGPARVVVSHENITERREAEEEKARLTEYNRLLLESTAEGIYGMDMWGRCTFINRAAALLLGYTAEEVQDRDMHALIHHSHADGSHYPIQECPIYETFGLNLSCHVETEVLWRQDGTCFPASYSSLPMSDAGGVIGAVVTFTDITERRRVEREKEASLAEAREQADRDPLTGLLNHPAFYSRLDAEAARARREGTALAVVMLDLDGFKFFNDVYGHATGDEVLRLVADRLRAACRPYDTPARFGGDEFALLLPAVGRAAGEEIEARLRAALRGMSCRAGEGAEAVPVSVSLGVALFPDGATDSHAVLRRADERLHWAKTGGTVEENARRVRADAVDRVQGFSMLDALVAAVDNKDRYTRRHSEDVMEYSLMIARALGMGEAQQRAVAVSAQLHDVGKIGVPDHVLRKPGRLSDAEFEAVRQHPMMGAVMVQAVPGLEETLDAVRHHHERWDGAGYPSGLRGEETPLIARLMAVADAFSAMTTDRPYRQGMDRTVALDILAAGAGTQWDPACVAAFLSAQGHGKRGD